MAARQYDEKELKELLRSAPRVEGSIRKAVSDRTIREILDAFPGKKSYLATIVGGTYVHKHRPTVDLNSTPACQRKLMTLTKDRKELMRLLNEDLRGGKAQSWPVLLACGLASVAGAAVGVGVAGLIATTSGKAALLLSKREATPLAAREGDEIWQRERIGKQGQNLMHVVYYTLVDPFRVTHMDAYPGMPYEWCIYEERFELVLQ